MTNGLLLLIVAYKNADEVVAFVDHARQRLDGPLHFAICDNSPVAAIHDLPGCLVVDRPDNPGYLEGAMVALRAFQERFESVPPWVAITNTDLVFERSDLLEVLRRRLDPSVPVVVAPRVLENGIEMNPHLLHRRSARRLRMNHYVTSTKLLAGAYLVLSESRRRKNLTRPTFNPVPQRQEFYSPYGAIMIFSRAFMNSEVIPANVPLFAEEYAIAEAAISAGARVILEPDIVVTHTANSTTGAKIAWRRADKLRLAFRYIAKTSRQSRV